MENKTKKEEFSHIGDMFKQNIISRFRAYDDLDMLKVWDIWAEAVGDTIAQNAKPDAFKKDILIVSVNNSVLVQQLHFVKKDLIEHINEIIGKKVVGDIKFRS